MVTAPNLNCPPLWQARQPIDKLITGTGVRVPVSRHSMLTQSALGKQALNEQASRVHLRVAWLCGMVLFLEGYDIAAVGYAIPALVDTWRITASGFTPALTAGNVGLLLGSLSAGLLGDRLGRKPVLISCVALFGVFSLLSAIVASPFQLAVLRFLTGIGLGGSIPLAIALTSDFAPPAAQGRLVVLMSSGIPIGFLAAGLLASKLVTAFGWEGLFVVGGVLPLAATPALLLLLPDSVELLAATRRPSLVSALFRNGLATSTALLWAMNLFNLLSNYLLLLWMPALLHTIGVRPAWATLFALGNILGGLLTASVVDRLGTEPVLTCVFALGSFCMLMLGLLSPPSGLLAIIMCGAGIGIGGGQSGLNSLSSRIYPPDIRSTGAGWAVGWGRIGNIAGPLLGGTLLMCGFRAREIFVAGALPMLGAAVLMAFLGWFRGADVAAPRSETIRDAAG
jgi:MFS transporter, AAHS family, 4-hydroxybenzoate transporter